MLGNSLQGIAEHYISISLVDLTGKIQELSTANERKQDALRQVVESRLDKLNESNNEKLEQMR